MKWFNKWFAKKCKEALEYSNSIGKEPAAQLNTVSARTGIDSNGMNFTVFRANGGHVIETRRYDRKRDHSDHSLHIITDDKDLGEEIGRIITFEHLRS